jgi:predicted DNA-binding transcriptional regulator YafY
LTYCDRTGAVTSRTVEPLGLLWGPRGWYLAAWCRLRSAVRGFQLDQITSLEPTGERVTSREPHWEAELRRLDAESFAK